MPLRIAVSLVAILLLTAVVLHESKRPAAAQTDNLLIEARITAERQDDNRVKVALELRRESADWTERLQPQRRYLSADAPIDVWRYSEPLPPIDGVPGRLRIAARRTSLQHVELALQRDLGDGWGDLQLPRARLLRSIRTPFFRDRFPTSSIDLIDNGPQRCRLGLLLGPGDRCRFPDTRELLFVDDAGVAHYPTDPARSSSDSDDGMLSPSDPFPRAYFAVPFLHGILPEAISQTVWIDLLADGRYLIRHLGRDRLHPVNSAVCTAGLLIPFGHYCGMPAGYVWFVVYPEGPAHLTVPNHELSWVSDADIHAEVSPQGNVGSHTVHAVREAEGWRITTLEAPNPPVLPFTPIDLGPCAIGTIVGRGESCSDPTSHSTFWVNDAGHWGWDDGLPNDPNVAYGGISIAGHPANHSFGYQPLTDSRWLLTWIAGALPTVTSTGNCYVGLLVYPGETCSADGPSWFWVFPDGMAAYHRVVDRNRIHVEDIRVRYSSGRIYSYDFTAERQDDGSFQIVHMDVRLVQPEIEPEAQAEP